MNETAQSTFEGWAILEIFGHSKFAGFVRTEAFGGEVMFRCDVPELPERERVTKSGCYVVDGPARRWVPGGSTIKAKATPAFSKLFGVKSIFSITPCDSDACLAAVEQLQERELLLVTLPPEQLSLPAGLPVCGHCGDAITTPVPNYPGVCMDCREQFADDRSPANEPV